MRDRTICAIAFLAIAMSCHTGFAFNGHRVEEGPLTLTIEEVPTVTEYETPQTVSVKLQNSGDQSLDVALELKDLVDEWRLVGKAQKRIQVNGKGEASVTFQIVAGRECHSAHYPVHVYVTFNDGNQKVTAHAVRVFLTDFKASAQSTTTTADFTVQRVPERGALPLASVSEQRVSWSYLDQPLVHQPVGWQGSEPTSRASFSRGATARGETRQALHMHPPYRPRAGTIFAEYRVRLPKTEPLRLKFYNAIRDHSAKEPPSDGVTFRVWANDEVLFERHSDSKRWLPGEADLSRFAGREIILRLESHPGPKRSTTCDSSYWGDPVVVAGEEPQVLTAAERQELIQKAIRAIETNSGDSKSLFVFTLSDGCRAAIALGKHGLTDAAIAFGSHDRTVVFDGLRMSVLDQTVGESSSGILTESVQAELDNDGQLHVAHRLRRNDELFDLTLCVWSEDSGLRIKVDCPERITDVALGPADQKAPRAYYGHGFCLVNPKAFRASGGGHNLSTSHVGFDFERGVSLLVACDTPPGYLQVDPELNLYTLHSSPNTTLTLVPSIHGALNCAVKYRPLYDKQPSDGVARKAGRFCFDIWGGRYAEDSDMMQRCFDYGLEDSLVIMHVWQRWGYDYRLPDIYPPNPQLGTLEDLQAFSKLCAERDVPFGLHDNYIDFYPDAQDFSYEHICFTPDGRPQKAWINAGRDAQSYRWRPDHIQPFVERNLRLIQPNLPQSAYFIDVFTSANSFDYYDRQGTFHSRLETRQAWGRAFSWIRNFMGNHAPMVSEAGGDHLIGSVDGADCQFLQIGPKPERFHIAIGCEDWARVPWFDAVNHTRFSLHGVGYSGRYQGGRSRDLHGIESDDYISAELLTGHALMIDRPGLVHGAVRKYWLAQDLIRSLANDEIERVDFGVGDIHRLIVTWKSGARICINRGQEDWKIEGHVLPQYGYYGVNGSVESSIERIDGVLVEQSKSKGKFYVNGRGFLADAPLAIRPTAKDVEYLGDRRFKLLVDWDAQQPAPKDLSVFMHFFKPQVSRLVLTGFYGGSGKPPVPTSQWQGRITTGEDWTVTLPDDCPPGEYDILVGLYDPSARGRRYRLMGDEDTQRRYQIGTLVVEGKKNDVTGVRLERAAPWADESLAERLRPNTTPIDFGTVKTAGAVRCEVRPDRLIVTPLPDAAACMLTLRLDRILGRPAKVHSAYEVDSKGDKVDAVTVKVVGQEVTLETDKAHFGYHIMLAPN